MKERLKMRDEEGGHRENGGGESEEMKRELIKRGMASLFGGE
jgi:hypothetical protein